MEKPTDTPITSAALPVVMDVTEEARRELVRVQSSILDKSRELLHCEETDLPRISRELQRLRVVQITLNELVTNISDPTAKQEINLLTKMMMGRDSAEVTEEEADQMAAEAAADRLRALGIDPESADNMARGLRALQAVMHRGPGKPTPDPAA